MPGLGHTPSLGRFKHQKRILLLLLLEAVLAGKLEICFQRLEAIGWGNLIQQNMLLHLETPPTRTFAFWVAGSKTARQAAQVNMVWRVNRILAGPEEGHGHMRKLFFRVRDRSGLFWLVSGMVQNSQIFLGGVDCSYNNVLRRE